MQPVIINERIADNFWLSAIDDQDLPAEGQIATLGQWQIDPSLPAVMLQSGDDPSLLFDYLDPLQLIVVHFPDFNDGRGFSSGRALREAGYRGELRASGQFLIDQLQFLKRCGFNAFDLPEGTCLEAAIASIKHFTIHYQAAQDRSEPLFALTR